MLFEQPEAGLPGLANHDFLLHAVVFAVTGAVDDADTGAGPLHVGGYRPTSGPPASEPARNYSFDKPHTLVPQRRIVDTKGVSRVSRRKLGSSSRLS